MFISTRPVSPVTTCDASPVTVTVAVRVAPPSRANECGPEPRPRVLDQVDPGPGDARLGVDEVPGQPQAERLGLADAVALANAYTVFFCVSVGSTPLLSPSVRGGQVAGERHADVEVAQLVRGAVADHPDQADLGLAVPVVAEGDRHRVSSPGRSCSRARLSSSGTWWCWSGAVTWNPTVISGKKVAPSR